MRIRIRTRTVFIELLDPLPLEAQESHRLSIRLDSAERAGVITLWAKRHSEVATNTPGESGAVQDAVLTTYQVKHNHLPFGSCTGRLILTTDGLAYDSLDNINHSRQGELEDIKELERGYPYQLEIKPFAGRDYGFQLSGRGMDNREYKDLVERITKARVMR